jgi:hypothetical protein
MVLAHVGVNRGNHAGVSDQVRRHTPYPRPPKWRGRPLKRRPRIKPVADHLTAGLASFTLPHRLVGQTKLVRDRFFATGHRKYGRE